MSDVVKPFLGDDFLLSNKIAIELYHGFASQMPILDYHNHLSPKDIAENRRFDNLTAAWLEGDHYKWRAMRANGIAEHFCTGAASPSEKFNAWASTVPFTLRNPLYHWTHLELKNYFGVSELLNETTSQAVYGKCSALLKQDNFRAQGLLQKMNVKVVCTTDDPIDSLEHHQQFSVNDAGFKMFPTFRPDKAYSTNNPVEWNQYIDKLSGVVGASIKNFDDLVGALTKRISFFSSLGCRSADHGLESLYFDSTMQSAAPGIFLKIRQGNALTTAEGFQFKGALLFSLCQQYHAAGWVQQFHLGARRSNNSRMLKLLGPDTGFDSIGEFTQADQLAKFLDALDVTDQLAKTILYNINPSQNEVFATMAGNFNEGPVAGKIQFGSGWWFLDQKDGMEKQMNALSNMGLLSRFVGMITDSRSFLSFPRHEYFRRILCNLIGTDVMKGEIPNDIPLLGKMIQDISYNNTNEYFGFRL